MYELLGGRVHERLRSYTYIYPDARVSRARTLSIPIYGKNTPSFPPSAPRKYVKQGFTAVKFDPAAPYSPFDPRQPSLELMELCEKFVPGSSDRRSAPRPICCSARMANSLPRGRCALRGELRPLTILSGSRSRRRPRCPRKWRWSLRGTSIPIATGERLVTKYEFSRVLECAAASILQMALGRVGGIMEAKKIAAMAEAHYAQIAPHLYCGPVEGGGEHPVCGVAVRISSSSRASRRSGGFYSWIF